MKPRTRILAAAPLVALLLMGVGCGQLWDKYIGGEDDYTDRNRESDQRFSDEMDRQMAEEDAKERAEQEAKDALRRAPTQTYLNLAKKTPAELRAMGPIKVPVLALDGEKFPFPEDQFTKTQPDHCKVVHYHGGIGFSLTFKKVREPDDDCGFGSAVADEQVDTETIIRWMQEGPKAVHL